MHRLTRLLILATFAVSWLGCGTPPEPTAETEQAVWGPPWSCNPTTYDPYAQPFVLGFCLWQPQVSNLINGVPEPAGIAFCAGATPEWAIDIYSAENFTGSCARVLILPGQTFSGNSQEYVALNGWHAVNKGHVLSVKSWKLGAHTEALFCDAEPGPGWTCPTGIGVGNGADGPFVANSWGVENREGFEMAAFEILQF